MTFNSISYILFLPIVFIVFSVVACRYRWLILLVSSYIFYGFLLKPVLLIVLTVVILITYLFGRVINDSEDKQTRKKMLIFGVLANLSILIYFKYFPFLIDNLNLLFKMIHLNAELQVPPHFVSIGFSFFIFQAISYLSDIYFRMTKPEPNLGYFALHMSFFPKLLEGPIERSGTLIPQLKAPYDFNYENVRSGMLLFTWGLFKKVVVADRLALYVNPVFSDVHAYTGTQLILAAYAYSLQIYFDFAGYTDMARGTARMFGINLTENFRSPYLATSCADFWKRWHISLSSWILDYIFEPLQMKFRNWGKLGTSTALLITFITCGIWHGANWCYVIFGLLHGIYLVASMYYKPYKKKLYKLLNVEKSKYLKVWQVFVMFNLMSFAFMIFRAESVMDAWYYTKSIFLLNIHSYTNIVNLKNNILSIVLLQDFASFVMLLMALTLIIIVLLMKNVINVLSINIVYRWSIYVTLVLLIIFTGVFNGDSFVYFKF